ncbi:MAG: hypothetical protein KA248_08170 [Kiritimatiellae bacterium]|nr:hypothetical protein [Kiritimatiellia bacterium]
MKTRVLLLFLWAGAAFAQPPPTNHTLADHVHESLSGNVARLSRWVDSFFGNFPVEEERLGNRVRLIPMVEFREGDTPDLKLRVHAKLRLPRFSRRLGLVLSAFRDEDAAQYGVPGQFAADEDVQQAALRYVIEEEKRARLSADLGLRFDPEVDPYLRLRWRYQLTDDPVASRVVQYLYWSPRRGWGETSRFEMESKIAPKTFARSTTAATWSERSRGVDWAQTFSTWHYFSLRRAAGLEWLTEGFTDPRASLEKSRLSLKYRRRVSRDWLFIQVGPFVELPRDQDFDVTPGLTFQVETVFGDSPFW